MGAGARRGTDGPDSRHRSERLLDHRRWIHSDALERGASAFEEGIEAGGHDDRVGDDFAIATDERFDRAAHVHDLSAPGEGIEVGGIEYVALIGLVEDDDLS